MFYNTWYYKDNNWYRLTDSGAMEVNTKYDTGIVNSTGAWVTERELVNYHIWTDEEKSFWDGLMVKFGIADKEYISNGDGTYTMSCAFDRKTVLPDLMNIMVEKGLYEFSGFTWNWQTRDGALIITLSNTQGY